MSFPNHTKGDNNLELPWPLDLMASLWVLTGTSQNEREREECLSPAPPLLYGAGILASTLPGDRIRQVAWASDFRLLTLSLSP